jgi:D-lactate dehydrogenase (cytochrome)
MRGRWRKWWQERGLLRGLKAGARLAMAGLGFVDEGCWSQHLVCAGRSRVAVEEDMIAARAIAAAHAGRDLPNSIPRAPRADLFPPLDNIVGADRRSLNRAEREGRA